MILRVHPQSRLANQRRFGLRAYPQPKKAKCSARTTTAPRSCLGRGGDLQSSKTANEPEGRRGLRASGRKEARHIQPPPKRSESIFVAGNAPACAPLRGDRPQRCAAAGRVCTGSADGAPVVRQKAPQRAQRPRALPATCACHFAQPPDLATKPNRPESASGAGEFRLPMAPSGAQPGRGAQGARPSASGGAASQARPARPRYAGRTLAPCHPACHPPSLVGLLACVGRFLQPPESPES